MSFFKLTAHVRDKAAALARVDAAADVPDDVKQFVKNAIDALDRTDPENASVMVQCEGSNGNAGMQLILRVMWSGKLA